MIRAIWKWFRTMNCRGLFASALTQQQQIKLPHICIPKAYTYLHFISSHLGYVVRKCYDLRTTVCCFTLCGFGKKSLWFIREQSPIWWDLQNEIGMHENLRVSTAESCQWRRVIALFFSSTAYIWNVRYIAAEIHQPPHSLPRPPHKAQRAL